MNKKNKKEPYKPTQFDFQRIADLELEISKIIQVANQHFKERDFQNSSKLYRQASSLIKKAEGIIDPKQNFSDRNSLNDLSGKQWLKHTKSWIVADGKPSEIPKEIKNHPGSFPPQLAEHFIEFFTKKDMLVLDPFVGIGSTLVACKNLHRNGIGIELNKEYANYAENRLKKMKKASNYFKIFADDARNIKNIWQKNSLETVDFVFTSPPYFNILGKSRGGVESAQKKRIKNGLDEIYSNNPKDIGNIDNYNEYLKIICNIFKDIDSIIREKSYLCIVVQNFRPKDGVMRPLAWDISSLLKDVFTLRQEFIWCQNQKQLGIWGYPTTYVSNVHHHYCLIFQKE